MLSIQCNHNLHIIPSFSNNSGLPSTASQAMPAYTTNFVMTSTSYRTRGFSRRENIRRSLFSSSLPLSLQAPLLLAGGVNRTPPVGPVWFMGVERRGLLHLTARYDVELFGSSGVIRDSCPWVAGTRSDGADACCLGFLACSRLAIISLASASDCGPTEIVRFRLRIALSMLGMSEAGGSTLSSLRSCGTVL